MKILGLDYEIVYKRGAANGAVDALLRLPGDSEVGKLQAISKLQMEWVQEVLNSYTGVLKPKRLFRALLQKNHLTNSMNTQKGSLEKREEY